MKFIPAILGPSVTVDANALVVSPDGSGTSCSVNRPCALTTARDTIRTINQRGGMDRNITVYLRGGTYILHGAFSLQSTDSGTNGYTVAYAAYPKEFPVLSGGLNISGWVLHDSGRNIFRATVPAGLNFRQLYVNGKRGIRARSATSFVAATQVPNGFQRMGSDMQGWNNRTHIEVVGFNEWRSFRCPVGNISGNEVYLQNPCWSNATGSLQPDAGFDAVAWVENAYELLDQQGEWYLNRSTNTLYYKPRAGENIYSASVVAPVAQTILAGTGTWNSPVANLSFIGLTFAYSTWLTPSSGNGYADLQAGYHFTGAGTLEETPAAVQFTGARNILFENNVFTHLGGAGLTVKNGSQSVLILGNRFEDISSSGIQLGNINDNTITDHRQMNRNNAVKDNVIINNGAEYHDAVGIFVGYARDTVVEYNEVLDLPYSGISLGWGWGSGSYASGNVIRRNRIENIMHTLRDGGAIYTLSPQPESDISYNYVCMQLNTNGGIYPDQGSSQFAIHHNVLSHVSDDWLHLHVANNNLIYHNFTDNVTWFDEGTGNSVTDTVLVQGGQWPNEARAIMQAAGVTSAHAGSGRASFCMQNGTTLFVEDDGDVDESPSRSHHARALYALGVPFANWDTVTGEDEPGGGVLSLFDTVIWAASDVEVQDSPGPGSGTESSLSGWLGSGQGHKLFMTSKAYHNWAFSSSFQQDYMGISFLPGGYVDGSVATASGWLGQSSYALSDNVSTTTIVEDDSDTVMKVDGQTLGVSKNGGNYRTIYWGFPFETLASDQAKTALMDAMLRW